MLSLDVLLFSHFLVCFMSFATYPLNINIFDANILHACSTPCHMKNCLCHILKTYWHFYHNKLIKLFSISFNQLQFYDSHLRFYHSFVYSPQLCLTRWNIYTFDHYWIDISRISGLKLQIRYYAFMRLILKSSCPHQLGQYYLQTSYKIVLHSKFSCHLIHKS